MLAYTAARADHARCRSRRWSRGTQWIEANVRSMRPVLDRVGARVGGGMGLLGRPGAGADARRCSRHRSAASPASSRSACSGSTTCRCSTRPARRACCWSDRTSAPPRERMSVDGGELLHWVTLHELTHAVQFGSVPVAAAAPRVARARGRRHARGQDRHARKGMRVPSADDLREIVDSVRRGELVTLVIGRERRVLVDRIQATMAVVEGHAEHVMDAVGADVIPSHDAVARGARAPARGAFGPDAAARARPRIRAEAAPVPRRQALLRRGRRARRHRGPQPRLERARTPFRRSPSWPIRTAWIARTAVLFVTK